MEPNNVIHTPSVPSAIAEIQMDNALLYVVEGTDHLKDGKSGSKSETSIDMHHASNVTTAPHDDDSSEDNSQKKDNTKHNNILQNIEITKHYILNDIDSTNQKRMSNVNDTIQRRKTSRMHKHVEHDRDYSKIMETAIVFRTGMFIKEIIYNFLQYLALPYILLFDGGLVSAENHVFLPIIRELQPVAFVPHMIWLTWAFGNFYWLFYLNWNDEKYFYDQLFLNTMFLYRCVLCAMRYAYLSPSYIKKYVHTKPGKVGKGWGNTLLINGWGFAPKEILKQEFADAQIRCNIPSMKDARLHLQCIKTSNQKCNNLLENYKVDVVTDVETFVWNLIETSTKFIHGKFIYAFVFSMIYSMLICATNIYISSSFNKDIIYLINWCVCMMPMLFGNTAYLFVASFDFLRLHKLSGIILSLLVPFKYRLNMVIEDGILRRIKKKIIIENEYNYDMNMKDYDFWININDLNSIYIWNNLRQFIFEYGYGFRKRELGTIATVLACYGICISVMVYRYMFNDVEIELNHYIVFGMGMFGLLVPSFFTISFASKIQKNMILEHQSLQRRITNMNYDNNSVFLNDCEQQDNRCNINHYLFFEAKKQSAESILKLLAIDQQHYAFNVLGIRVDQGIIQLLWPMITSLLVFFFKVLSSKFL